MHNKLRGLPPHVGEAKAYLKAAAAWLLLRAGDVKPTSVGMYVKVFQRAGQELVAVDKLESNTFALSCINQAIASWCDTGYTILERSLNPVEFDQLKTSIIQLYMEKLKLLNSSRSVDITTMKECVSGSIGLLSSAHFSVRIHFVNTVSKVGQFLSHQSEHEVAAFFFQIGLQTLDTMSIDDIDELCNASNKSSLIWLKIKLNFCLSFVFSEQNQFEKGLECIRFSEALYKDPTAKMVNSADENFEHNSAEVANAFTYAKFTINCKARDFEHAKANIRTIIDSSDPTNLEEVLNMINSYQEMKNHKNVQDVEPLFDNLLFKYKDEVEQFNSIRIALLKLVLQSDDEPSIPERNPRSLADTIISDHLSAVYTLSHSLLLSTQSFLRKHITWCHLQYLHEDVILWSDLVLKLFSNASSIKSSSVEYIPVGEGLFWGENRVLSQDGEEKDTCNSDIHTLLQRAESLLSLDRYEEAFDSAKMAMKSSLNSKTIAVFFICSVYVYQDANKAIKSLLSNLWPFKVVDGQRIEIYPKCTQGFVNNLTNEFRLMTLERLMACTQLIADRIDIEIYSRKTMLIGVRNQLLETWLEIFESWEIWKCQDDVNCDILPVLDQDFEGNGTNPTYLSILCVLMDDFYQSNKRMGSTDEISSNDTSLEITSSTQLLKSHASNTLDNSSPVNIEMDTDGDSLGAHEVVKDTTDATYDQSSYNKHDATTIMGERIDKSTNQFQIQLSLDAINSHKDRFRRLMHMASSGATICKLGESSDLKWLGDFCWNIGNSLLDSFRSMRDDSNCRKNAQKSLLSAAEFLEYADLFYSYVDLHAVAGSSDGVEVIQTYQSIRTNQGVALLIASAARLDVFKDYMDFVHEAELSFQSIDSTSSNPNDLSPQKSSMNHNLDCALHDTVRARQLFVLNGGFEDQRLNRHMNKTLILEFHNICFRVPQESTFSNISSHSISQNTLIESILHKNIPAVTPCFLTEFFEKHKNELQKLEPIELRKCADIARHTPGGNLEISRALLEISIQLCTREHCPNYQLIGSMYHDLISSAANRQWALEKIEDFLQLLTILANQGDENVKLFGADDIDGICSISYNYGISLMELEITELAEKFISKSLALLVYASPVLAGWKGNIQDAYAQVHNKKNVSRECWNLNQLNIYRSYVRKQMHECSHVNVALHSSLHRHLKLRKQATKIVLYQLTCLRKDETFNRHSLTSKVFLSVYHDTFMCAYIATNGLMV